jgi:hypothetical protein
MNRLDKNLIELATMSPAQLREKWCEIFENSAPSAPMPLLGRLLAQRLQEKRHGRLPLLVVRELERVVRPDSGTNPAVGRKKVTLTAGTRLVREWNGKTVAVEVQEDGFLWEGRTYRSLSVIAREVTGAHWSGPRFFGIGRRG